MKHVYVLCLKKRCFFYFIYDLENQFPFVIILKIIQLRLCLVQLQHIQTTERNSSLLSTEWRHLIAPDQSRNSALIGWHLTLLAPGYNTERHTRPIVGGTLLACVVMAKTLAQSTVSCPPIRAQYLDWSGPMRGQHSGCPVVWRWERERGEQSLLWARGFILLLKHRPCILLTGFVPSLLGKLCSATKRAWFILPWTSSREMSPFYKLGVVNHPEAAEVILVSHKTLVEWQVGANGVLQGAERRGKRRKN